MKMLLKAYSKESITGIISKNLAELKANKVSQKNQGFLVIGAGSVIDLGGELISKPINRDQALEILKNLMEKNMI